jgi:hypothetical protein
MGLQNLDSVWSRKEFKWDVCPDITGVFSKLRKYSPVITERDQFILEMFVIMMHDRSSPTARIDDARVDLFPWSRGYMNIFLRPTER